MCCQVLGTFHVQHLLVDDVLAGIACNDFKTTWHIKPMKCNGWPGGFNLRHIDEPPPICGPSKTGRFETTLRRQKTQFVILVKKTEMNNMSSEQTYNFRYFSGIYTLLYVTLLYMLHSCAFLPCNFRICFYCTLSDRYCLS